MSEKPSIRERIHEIGIAMVSGDPSPAEARKHEVMVAGLLEHINKAVTGAEVAYKKKLSLCRSECESASDAKIEAEASEQFADWLEAKTTRDSAMEMLRTLRSFGRSLSDEMRLQR
jgi:hypothetical protein